MGAHAREPQPYERVWQQSEEPLMAPNQNLFQTVHPAEWARAESFAPSAADFHYRRAESFAPSMAADFYIGSPMDPLALQNQNSQLGNSIVGPNYSQLQAVLAQHHDSQDEDRDLLERDIMERTLRDKQRSLGESLAKYGEVGQKLRFAPSDEALLRAHAEAEIEAAGFQAEVAVLTQHLNDLDEALRLRAT